MSLPQRDPVADVTPADWIVARVSPFRANLVTSLLPAGFAAYARVFHPARAFDDAPVRWAEVARANGRIAHPAMDWVGITGDWRYLHEANQPELWQTAPEEGSLPPREAGWLTQLLSAHTGAARWWYALWVGFGNLPGAWHGRPTVAMPQREMYLFGGEPGAAASSFAPPPWHQSANLWWPDDAAWCVATDIDLMSTYIGGSRDAIAAVVAHPELEAAEVPPTQTLAYDTDTLNPLPVPR